MATLTIRGVDEVTRQRIQVRAARNRRSMEAEVRHTLSQVYDQPLFGDVLLQAAASFREETGGVDLVATPRTMPRIQDLVDGQS